MKSVLLLAMLAGSLGASPAFAHVTGDPAHDAVDLGAAALIAILTGALFYAQRRRR